MGLEDVALKHLEKGTLEQFEQYCGDILKADPKYADVFLYALAVADAVSTSFFKNETMLLGGYGVLGHMMDVKGPDVVRYWRGSHDLDIACQTPQSVAYLLRSFASDEHQSLSLPDKKTAKFRDSYVEEIVGRGSVCDADIYYPSDTAQPDRIRVGSKVLQAQDFALTDTIVVYDVPLKIHNIYGLLGMKLGVVTSENLPRPKDITDIYNLLGVCEQKDFDAETILGKLTNEEKSKLMEVFEHTSVGKDKYVLVQPSRMYLSDLIQLNYEGGYLKSRQ